MVVAIVDGGDETPAFGGLPVTQPTPRPPVVMCPVKSPYSLASYLTAPCPKSSLEKRDNNPYLTEMMA